MRFSTLPVARRARAPSLAAALRAGAGSVRRGGLTRWGSSAVLISAGSGGNTSTTTAVTCSGVFGAASGTSCITALHRWQSTGSHRGGMDGMVDDVEGGAYAAEDSTGLNSELARELEGEGNFSTEAGLAQPLLRADLQTPTARIRLEKIERPPGRFDMLTNSLVYRWQTTAALARKVTGPMREWATELKYRTGVHIEVEPTYPERAAVSEADGGYASADDVELTLYLFGSERGIFNCRQLMEAALDQDPAYVRLGVFRRKPGKHSSGSGSGGGAGSEGGERSGMGGSGSATANPNEEVEWLMLRRFNRDLRPPDIPPISLKLPGKWTMLFEQYKEAAVRSLWEETGITVDPNTVYPTAVLNQSNPEFYWRVPVHYFIAEVPYDVEVRGPQVGQNTYMHHWESHLLRVSPDPIDRAWAQLANPETGCAWMKVPMIDELQRPLRGENYMVTRYTPPPYSGLNDVLGFSVPAPKENAAAEAAGTAAAEGTDNASAEKATEENVEPSEPSPPEPTSQA